MVSQHFHQIILQKSISTAGIVLASQCMDTIDMSLLGKSSLLCKLNQVGFALPLEPVMGHGERYRPSRVSVAMKKI